jgi:hypothetical protein
MKMRGRALMMNTPRPRAIDEKWTFCHSLPIEVLGEVVVMNTPRPRAIDEKRGG